jgi:RNA polymerase sigma-70 factor (ECF subfamily)
MTREDRRSDAELLSASAADPEAFGVFYDRNVRALLAFFYRRTACPQTAADLTAETFAVAFAARHRFRDVGAPGLAWLLGIARREFSAAMRREKVHDRARRRLGMERIELDEASAERIEALADLAPLRAAVEAALDSLTPKVAEAVSLRVERDLPYAEVARRIGCSEGAARVRVARGLAKLADQLEAP